MRRGTTDIVVPGRTFRAGPGAHEHRHSPRFLLFVFMGSGLAGGARAPE